MGDSAGEVTSDRDMRKAALDMLHEAIAAIEDGSAKYVILAVLGENEGDEFSICTGEADIGGRAEQYLRNMLDDVAARPHPSMN